MPAVAVRRVAALVAAVAVGALPGCSGDAGPDRAPSTAAAAPTTSVTLPPDPLSAFVPAPGEVPRGLLPVVAGSGPRDLAAVAAFSGDPTAAATALRGHGFVRAYVGQYAEPVRAGRVLSVVVSEFATLKGAADDLAGDVAASGRSEQVPDVGQGASLRAQDLPGGGPAQLTTLRFRVGTRTWLVAYGARTADREVVLGLGRLLAARAAPA